ncbi:hypothetical protein FEM48_Zijuj04G0050500 [Ziziphus jujuba var. spinosa]|uniref:Protein FAR1-RELATED SEQUENCE n=1 Tax=Ziziphus jujuba var. spinosa TaxID=714518 RepID=A0A978VHY4_ZIZJJ|nr:hypothetical protein FEM48_Zijuj04G0050500 [Ziziphus jujuba var. spinosa]
MEGENSGEAKDVGSSYMVSLEDEGGECCAVEDVGAAMVLDDDPKEYLGGGVVEPTLGMEFTSEEDARNFYNAYAKQTGFSIRVNSYYRSKKDNSIISREFCCSKEGFRRERRAKRVDSGDDAKRRRARPITREGCKALMTVRKRDNEKWYVAKLEKSHNHELVTPAMRHFLRSHKEECDPNKSSSNSFSSPLIGLNNSSLNALAEDGNSFGKVPFAVQTRVNYIGRGRLSTFGIDAQKQYEKALNDRYEKESKEEFETFYTKPVLKTPLPVEKQAAEIYTRKMFSIFQDEVFESLVLAVKLSGEEGGTIKKYEVARFDEEHKVYFVDFNITEQIATCSCKMFEFEGILCRHVLAVFKATNVFILPQHYILKRWTRNAKDVAMLHILPSVEMQGKSPKGKNLQYSILYQEAIKCAEEGLASDHIFKVALNALREARINIMAAKKNAVNAPKLDTMASTSNRGDSSEENNTSKYVLEQSSSGVSLRSNCKCPGHDRHTCLWLKGQLSLNSATSQEHSFDFKFKLEDKFLMVHYLPEWLANYNICIL